MVPYLCAKPKCCSCEAEARGGEKGGVREVERKEN